MSTLSSDQYLQDRDSSSYARSKSSTSTTLSKVAKACLQVVLKLKSNHGPFNIWHSPLVTFDIISEASTQAELKVDPDAKRQNNTYLMKKMKGNLGAPKVLFDRCFGLFYTHFKLLRWPWLCLWNTDSAVCRNVNGTRVSVLRRRWGLWENVGGGGGGYEKCYDY